MPEVTTFWGGCAIRFAPCRWTPSKARLNGFCNKWKTPVRCHRENLQGSTSLHFVGSHNGNGFREAHLQDGQNTGLRGLSEEYV
ncbi:hypothetical protein [Phocaeicola vulgatus]|uniref:hypothetical protein n=1 Tax=Phocaeicola vulgatus TaxID=821 RepID=UPI0011C4A9FB|nr:hypothetical protein [Phocaeicola vulgatus]